MQSPDKLKNLSNFPSDFSVFFGATDSDVDQRKGRPYRQYWTDDPILPNDLKASWHLRNALFFGTKCNFLRKTRSMNAFVDIFGKVRQGFLRAAEA